jgi:hypothetical protein
MLTARECSAENKGGIAGETPVPSKGAGVLVWRDTPMAKAIIGPLRVSHHPVGFGDSALELPWKQTVFDTLAPHWSDRPLLQKPVHIKLHFGVSQDRETKLDNPIKTTLDGIARVVFPCRKGASKIRDTWDNDDKWVYAREATKKKVRVVKPGMEITIVALKKYRAEDQVGPDGRIVILNMMVGGWQETRVGKIAKSR